MQLQSSLSAKMRNIQMKITLLRPFLIEPLSKKHLGLCLPCYQKLMSKALFLKYVHRGLVFGYLVSCCSHHVRISRAMFWHKKLCQFTYPFLLKPLWHASPLCIWAFPKCFVHTQTMVLKMRPLFLLPQILAKLGWQLMPCKSVKENDLTENDLGKTTELWDFTWGGSGGRGGVCKSCV